MKNVILNAFRSCFIFPLVILVAMAPVMCCCFESVASADIGMSAQPSPVHSEHCGAASDHHSESGPTQDCDCPHMLAESSPAHLTKLDTVQSMAGFFFTRTELLTAGFRVASAAPDATRFVPHQNQSPPLFLLHHTFRI